MKVVSHGLDVVFSRHAVCDMSVTPNHTTTSRDGHTCTRIQHLVHHLLKHWTLTTQLCRRKGGNVTKWSGAESSNANFSFPEHFEGKRQSGEMYQKDCLPLLSTFCKFQRLKVKGSQVTLVCGSNTVEHKWSGITVNKVQAAKRFSSFVPATLICVWLLKCTHGDSLEV